jgi:hypothetical protein
MEQAFSGKIVSSQVGSFGGKQFRYGFITVDVAGKGIKFKIDHDTICETVNVGDQVIVEADTLGETDILIAKSIRIQHIADDRKPVVEASS